MANPYETYAKHIALLKAMEDRGQVGAEYIKGINFLRKRGINVDKMFRYSYLAKPAPEKTAEDKSIRGKDYVPIKTSLSPTHHADECTVKHSKDGSVYVEEKVEVGGSIGGASTEGCEEHYFSRFIKINPEEEEDDSDYDAIRFAIVTGEVLNNPAYKRLIKRG